MERDGLASLAGFFSAGEPLARGAVVRLGEEAAHHMRVRRLDVGAPVYVADGAGTQATGSIIRLAKTDADVAIDDVARFESPPPIHLLVPIADRDRMLWCAEKCTELGLTSWIPVMWTRSRSVSPRGEGESFAAKVHARMTSALLQSRSPWLPEVRRDASFDDAVSGLPSGGTRLVLDIAGAPLRDIAVVAPATIAIGPEGGFEREELERLRAEGFQTVSVGANVLRFETAAVAALAIVRSALATSPEKIDG